MKLNTTLLLAILGILLMAVSYFAIQKYNFEFNKRDTIQTNPDDDGGLFQ